MAKRRTSIYGDAFSTDDVYLGELAAQLAQHERAEFARARHIIDDQQTLTDETVQGPNRNPWAE